MSDQDFAEELDDRPEQDETAARIEAIQHRTFDLGQRLVVLFADADDDLAHLARWLVDLQQIKREIVDLEQVVKDTIGQVMPGKTAVVEGLGVLHRSKRKSRTQWDKEDLRRAVLDTKLVDPETGEVTDESPLDKVLHVWTLGVPKVTALRERGLDADEWATVETKPGWDVRVDA